MSKPSVMPTWASTLANDPVTGQPNRVEPSAGKKVTGFNFNEKPPRQDVNWLDWSFCKWLQYFEEQMEAAILPNFMVPGSTLTIFTYATNVIRHTYQGYETGPIFTIISDTGEIDTTKLDGNPGFLILRKSFRRPLLYTKLNLSFTAKSSINIGNTRGVKTLVLKERTPDQTIIWDVVDQEIIEGTSLYSGTAKRDIQLDLSSESAGANLCLVQSISLKDVAYAGGDFTLDCGQLKSSWSA